MGKRDKFDAFVADAGKNAKNLLNKAIQVADQTDDGKFVFATDEDATLSSGHLHTTVTFSFIILI